MKNPIRIRTNTIGEKVYDVYLYGDRRLFECDEDELMRNEDKEIMYSGPSADLPAQLGLIKAGARVTFKLEGNLDEEKVGEIITMKTTPYYEIEEELTASRFGVHRKYIKSADPTFQELADLYIQKLSEHNYRKYDLGAVKSRQKTFMTSTESLEDLTSKGTFVIMIVEEI